MKFNVDANYSFHRNANVYYILTLKNIKHAPYTHSHHIYIAQFAIVWLTLWLVLTAKLSAYEIFTCSLIFIIVGEKDGFVLVTLWLVEKTWFLFWHSLLCIDASFTTFFHFFSLLAAVRCYCCWSNAFVRKKPPVFVYWHSFLHISFSWMEEDRFRMRHFLSVVRISFV